MYIHGSSENAKNSERIKNIQSTIQQKISIKSKANISFINLRKVDMQIALKVCYYKFNQTKKEQYYNDLKRLNARFTIIQDTAGIDAVFGKSALNAIQDLIIADEQQKNICDKLDNKNYSFDKLLQLKIEAINKIFNESILSDKLNINAVFSEYQLFDLYKLWREFYLAIGKFTMLFVLFLFGLLYFFVVKITLDTNEEKT